MKFLVCQKIPEAMKTGSRKRGRGVVEVTFSEKRCHVKQFVLNRVLKTNPYPFFQEDLVFNWPRLEGLNQFLG